MTTQESLSSPNANRLLAVSQCLAEVGLYLQGVSKVLREGPDAVALTVYRGQIKDVADRLEGMRNELWLLQYETQVSREGQGMGSDSPGPEGTPPGNADPI